MREWFKRMSATLTGRLLAAAVLSQAVWIAALVAAWEHWKAAPAIVQATCLFAVIIIVVAMCLVAWVWLRSAPSPGIYTPRHLQRFQLPVRMVSWNFDNYLGGVSGDGSPVEITGFQLRFRINRGPGIHPKKAFIQSRSSGETQDVLIECGDSYKRAEEIAFIPQGKWYPCMSAFESNKGARRVLKEEFLKRWGGFDFVFVCDEFVFKRHFPWDDLEDYIDRFWQYSNRPPLPVAIPRT
jgi:hypothetical protein